MASRVLYKASVERDLKKLDKAEAARVLDKIESDLAADPSQGEPLKGTFEGLLKHRIGDYRVVYAKTGEGILVLRVGHRRLDEILGEYSQAPRISS